MSSALTVTGTPMPHANMVAPWGAEYSPRFGGSVTLAIALPVIDDSSAVKIVRTELTLESFYELREAVNDLYDHIRQETSN